VRACAISSYDCVPLPRPVDAEEQLQQVESMEFGQLKGTFLEEYYMLEVISFSLAHSFRFYDAN
jgi:hypothetical protein